ncbi:hypothetical protein Thimo_2925 [Thioflavicoccus mobilis 8321]|uniref:Uncharacterized protein n=1 Tax=Thioflavicoccus mobilis 8321 TaxID=765912 RepID=L0H1U3_9GAMM|nr:hypothetical protein [Thioflavicoccus mobilis]AGA91620.1 hypothetical protein Thimo_2925 [Thioflavicoccus mobilis 8321]
MKKRHLSSFGIHSLLPAIAVTGMSLVLFLVLSVVSAPSNSAGHQAGSAAAPMRY